MGRPFFVSAWRYNLPMAIHFVDGDLFAAPFHSSVPVLDARAHGCNCAGSMGAGIAVEFARRSPAMLREYKRWCRDGRLALGKVFVWEEVGAPWVYNLGTQKHWRSNAELWAIEEAMGRMLEHAGANAVQRIGLPRVGAGLGGLDWQGEVKPLMARLGEQTPVDLFVVENYRKASAPS